MIKKKLILVIWIAGISTLIFFLAGEVLLRLNFLGQHKYRLSVDPHTLLEVDSVLGWKLNKGTYTIRARDSLNIFVATINGSGNRITSANDTLTSPPVGPNIQIYGCSFTFGFSVPDSATCSYKLQQMLPDVRVENKGVPAYGLAQMLLSLKQNVSARDTPSIAIFNYANFHDIRTPVNKNWSALIGYAITSGYSPRFRQMKYPYVDFNHDTMELHYCYFNDLAKDWPGSDNISLIRILNAATYAACDMMAASRLHRISEKTTLEIAQYCKSNHIIPIFATLTPGKNDDIIDTLAKKGYYTVNYGITVWDRYKPNQYNCAPLDPEHPNGLAHSIYARKLFDFIKEKHLLDKEIHHSKN